MRTAVLIALSALTLAGCDAVQNPFAKKDGKPAAATAAPATPATATSAPATGEVLPPSQVAPANALPPAPPPAPVVAPAAPVAVRWSPADYAKRERRLAGLIANAETRDGSGETQRRAEEGRYRRSRCATKACIEASYAAEEAWLKQWEGAGEVR